ncbi:ABC transporter permease [Liquorilactobacillus oeni]|nr:ABC transporter permease [Liquorilactobacillus oeni]
MIKIWEMRLKRYQKMLLHYSKFVLNDHFVIALLFFVGGAGLTYSNFLRTLPHTLLWWEKPLVLVILMLFLQAGSLTSLLQEPDTVFLLPQEYNLPTYLKKGATHSIIIAEFLQVFLLLLLFPLLLRGLHWDRLEVTALVIMQLFLKYSNVDLEVAAAYYPKFDSWLFKIWYCVGGPVLAIFLALYANVYFGLGAAVFFLIIQIVSERRSVRYVFRWNKMIQREKNRMMRWYRFINLFTDVPQVSGKVRRLKYFDKFLPQPKQGNTFYFLYWRTFLRKSDFSSLYLRLTFLGTFILLFIPNYWLSFTCLLLFQYLIGFQMIPLYFAFEGNVFMYLYPIEEAERLFAFRKILRKLLFLNCVIFNLCAVYATENGWGNLLLLAFSILEVFVFTGNYLTKRLRENT